MIIKTTIVYKHWLVPVRILENDLRNVRLRGLSTFLAIACCGCTAQQINRAFNTYEDQVDLATADGAENVAVVVGESSWVIPIDYDCWIESPAEAKRVIIDPGNIEITATCSGNPGIVSRTFIFDAMPGHTYEVDRPGSSWCLELQDITAEESIAKICK